MFKTDWWTVWGLAAQGIFFGSFVYQWWISEKNKKSLITSGFWYIRIGGSVMLLAYALVRRDLVISLGLVLQMILYLRNLKIIANEKRSIND